MKLSVYFLIGVFFIQQVYCMEMCEPSSSRNIEKSDLAIPLENVEIALMYTALTRTIQHTREERKNVKMPPLHKTKSQYNSTKHKEISLQEALGITQTIKQQHSTPSLPKKNITVTSRSGSKQ